MKLIEALKLIKEQQKKAEDLRVKVRTFCADLDFETPTYTDQRAQVTQWIQAHHDILKDILGLRLQIQRTNLATDVEIEIGGKHVKKSIAEWVHRRRDLAELEMEMWRGLTDRNLKEGHLPSSAPGGAQREVKLRRYYDPATRDTMLELFRSEPAVIDRTLEVVNATTDLVEAA